jgi:hypothetical protein
MNRHIHFHNLCSRSWLSGNLTKSVFRRCTCGATLKKIHDMGTTYVTPKKNLKNRIKILIFRQKIPPEDQVTYIFVGLLVNHDRVHSPHMSNVTRDYMNDLVDIYHPRLHSPQVCIYGDPSRIWVTRRPIYIPRLVMLPLTRPCGVLDYLV